jgi:hypothetical protein
MAKKAKLRDLSGADGYAAEASDLLDQLDAVLAKLDLVTLSDDERQHSNGRFRSGESAAITSVFDTVDGSPGLFVSLADKDGGVDPKKVETAPARAALARRDLVAPLADRVALLSRDLSDDVLASGSKVKDVSVPAYAILKSNAPVNATLRKSGSAAISFYGHAAKAGSLTKKKKKKGP